MNTSRHTVCPLLRWVTGVLALAGTLLVARADTLVIEHFGQTVADNSPVGSATGWYAGSISNSLLVDYSFATPNGNFPSMSRAANGGFGGVPGNSVMGAFGFGTPSFFWTNTTTVLHDAVVTNVTFYTKNNASSSTERLVVRINGQWFATTNAFKDTTANASWALNTFVFTNVATSWQAFDTNTLAPGATLTTNLPSGDITAVGLYGAMPVTGKIRLDEFSVNGLPPTPPIPGAPVATPAASVTAPTSVTLTVPTSGTAPLVYQWRKDASPISDGPSGTGSTRSGTTTNQLVISTTSTNDSGQYDLVVTNNYGTVTSAVVVVTVNTAVLPPSINSVTVNPVNHTNEVGTTPMSITVDAGGTGPLSYQWRKSNVDIPGQTSSSISLASAFTNAGSYTVVVTNTVGRITNSPAVVLYVIDTTPPTITFTNGLTNDTVIHQAYAPAYTTSDNSGQPVSVYFIGSVNTNVAGTYLLTYQAVDTSLNTNSGTLTVNVLLVNEHYDESTIDNGIVSQAPGWLAYGYTISTTTISNYSTTPNPPISANYPTLSKNPGNPGAVSGTGYVVFGDVFTVNPVLIYKDTLALLQDQQLTNLTFYTKNNDAGSQVYIAIHVGTNWYASTTSFSDTSANTNWVPHSFNFDTNAASWQTLDFSTLTLGSPLVDPLPNLSVSALGFFGNATAGKIRLDEFQARGYAATFANTPPTVSAPTASPLNPVDGTAWAGSALTIQAAGSGTLPLAYQWRRDGTNVSGATNSQLVIGSASPGDSGSYDLLVTNSGGAVTSSVLSVTVSAASLLVTEHFNESSVDPGIIGQAPGWHALAYDLTNALVTDFTLLPDPPLNLNYPNLSLSIGADGTVGYFVAGQAEAVNPILLWLDTTAKLANTAPTNLSFFSRNAFPSCSMQVAIKLAGEWYVSTSTLSDTTLGIPWAQQTFTFAPDAGAWQLLYTTNFSLGDVNASPLVLSNATAVGVYCNMSVGRMRIDEFRLTAITAAVAPQPTIQPVYGDGGGNLVLRTATTVGWNYVLESASNLTPPITWTPVTTNAGTGGTITNLIPVSLSNSRAFFRYHVQ